MSIELIGSEDFKNSELEAIKQKFEDAGFEAKLSNRQTFRKSLAPPPEIWIVFGIAGIVVTSFMKGFFGKMGEDAYGKFKSVIRSVIQNKKENGITQVKIKVVNDTINIIILLPDDIETLNDAFDKLPKFLDNNQDMKNDMITFVNGKWMRLRDMK